MIALSKHQLRLAAPNDYAVRDVRVDASRLTRRQQEDFWRLIRKWAQDDELSWLQQLSPESGRFTPQKGSVTSWGLPGRLEQLFGALAAQFPGLELSLNMEYWNWMLWEMGFIDTGGSVSIFLSDGKVSVQEIAYS